MRKTILTLIFCITALTLSAQEQFGGIVEFDKTVHDFGDILLKDGPQSCEFKMKNISDKPIAIYSVSTSCGCTDVKYTKEPIQPGATVTLAATFSNDQGPLPFDKTLTIRVSGLSKPILLKLRGSAHVAPRTLEENFPIHMGNLAFKETELKTGNIDMGDTRGDQTSIANLSQTPLKVGFTDITDGLTLNITPNPIPARGTATLTYSVTSRPGKWGYNTYTARPVIDGSKAGSEITVTAFTRDNFESLTDQQKANGPRPIFESSNFSAGKVKAGTIIKADWTFTNSGSAPLKIHKIDAEGRNLKEVTVPDTAPRDKGSFTLELDTTGIPEGELLIIVTLTTNSPSRPVVVLYVSGWII